MATYSSDRTYTRAEILGQLGVKADGGAWFTGHVRHAGEHYIFCNVGVAGRTGQNYDNHFDGAGLNWNTRNGAKLSHPVIADLISNKSPVHIFFRSDNKGPFSYNGLATAICHEQKAAVEIRWSFHAETVIPEEVAAIEGITEGARRQITVNAYERDPSARLRCIARWGTKCAVCEFYFEAKYGEHGRGYIHVHHLQPIASIGREYILNPEEDLRPVCPNCHAMLHRGSKQPLEISELKKLLRNEP